MAQFLSTFCKESGQKVKTSKSKLFVSENTPPSLAQSLSSKFDIPLTKDLGTHLGVPILHGRIGIKTYQFLVDNIKRKISGWKRHSLSKAA